MIKAFTFTCFLCSIAYTISFAQPTPEPFNTACSTGNLYQVVSGELIEFEYGGTTTDNGELVCPFEGVPVCETYTDITDPNNVQSGVTRGYNALGFNPNDNLFYGMRGNNMVRIGSNCTYEDLGEPTTAANAGCPNN
ncbi:MAG: hypothetical protein AAFP82_20420, partial [Bacteroidota bacterium]